MTRSGLAIAAAATLAATAAHADIYEWRDGSGARHFTNSKRGVPSDYQDSVRVLIIEYSAPPSAAPAVAVVAPPPAAEVAVVTDTDGGWDDGYRAGVQAAMTGGGGGSGGTVLINGPLAVATSRDAEAMPGYGYGFYPPGPWYYPFVTTSFDRGRSRHQTLRMLLQDQFQIDRDGPYGYDRWDEPGLGPALAPFLNRGLPFPVQQYGRVIYR